MRKILLLLLVIAMTALGVAQAGVDLCPPGCDHCEQIKVVQVDRHSCCETSDGVAYFPWPEDTGRSVDDGCSNGMICVAGNGHQDIRAMASFSPQAVVAGMVQPPDQTIFLSEEGAPCRLRPGGPPLRRSPDLFTRNCSFLI